MQLNSEEHAVFSVFGVLPRNIVRQMARRASQLHEIAVLERQEGEADADGDAPDQELNDLVATSLSCSS